MFLAMRKWEPNSSESDRWPEVLLSNNRLELVEWLFDFDPLGSFEGELMRFSDDLCSFKEVVIAIPGGQVCLQILNLEPVQTYRPVGR